MNWVNEERIALCILEIYSLIQRYSENVPSAVLAGYSPTFINERFSLYECDEHTVGRPSCMFGKSIVIHNPVSKPDATMKACHVVQIACNDKVFDASEEKMFSTK